VTGDDQERSLDTEAFDQACPRPHRRPTSAS
jgi:hypothetical protein